MKPTLYAQISTSDKNQNPMTQLLPLSEGLESLNRAAKGNDRKGFKSRFRVVLERLRLGQVSRCQAARELNIGYATLKRLIDTVEDDGGQG